MANPTTNFGWQMPTNSDLVTDLPADFEVFGQAVDTSLADLKGGTTGQVLTKASNTDMDFTWAADASGIPATILDAKGDLIAATAADTASRLAVGTNGYILTADSAEATGLKWAAPSAATTSYSLLSTTSLSGSSGVTISSLSGYNKLFVVIYQATTATASNEIRVRPNNNSGSNYNWGAGFITGATSWATTNVTGSSNAISSTEIDFAKFGSTGSSGEVNGYLMIDGANSSAGKKPIQYASGVAPGSGNAHRNYTGYTVYNEAAVISSLNIRVTGGTFSGGTVYIWGAN